MAVFDAGDDSLELSTTSLDAELTGGAGRDRLEGTPETTASTAAPATIG